MTDTRPFGTTYTLWGGALSLYTGKVRSYLIKKGIRYREYYASHPEFEARMRPIVRLGVTPILETPGGEVLQDSTEIITLMEDQIPAQPMIPSSPVQRIVAWLLDAYATEHLLLAAMYFRWAEPYRSEQFSFLSAEFGRVSYLGTDREARTAAGERMISYFSNVLPTIGGTAETAPAIEAAYFELLELLDIHFQHAPYLLGGHPSIADFGFMAPLYAHLGRDPAPARLMALKAPNVARWIERMNLAAIEDAEFPDMAPEFPADDALPATLEPILELVFRDWTPELLANAECYKRWVDTDPAMPSGTIVSIDGKRRVHPTIGPIEYPWRGTTMRRASAPQTLWHFELATAQARALTGVAAEHFGELVRRNGGEAMMAIKLARPIVRHDYVLALA